MSPLKSNRVAWSVAVAALALWATSVPATWGQVAGRAAGLFDQEPDESTSTSTSATTSITTTTEGTSIVTSLNADGAPLEPCLPVPPAISEIVPSIPTVTIPPNASADQGTFRLCGADPNVARAIEQLVAGRGFSTSLTS